MTEIESEIETEAETVEKVETDSVDQRIRTLDDPYKTTPESELT